MVERHPDGPAAMLMLLKFIEAHEARQAAREALEGQVGGQRPGQLFDGIIDKVGVFGPRKGL